MDEQEEKTKGYIRIFFTISGTLVVSMAGAIYNGVDNLRASVADIRTRLEVIATDFNNLNIDERATQEQLVTHERLEMHAGGRLAIEKLSARYEDITRRLDLLEAQTRKGGTNGR